MEVFMEYDEKKVDEIMLALMYIGFHENDRVWKTFDWNSLNRLFEKELISNPINKAKSVLLTVEGKNKAQEFFEKYLGVNTESKNNIAEWKRITSRNVS